MDIPTTAPTIAAAAAVATTAAAAATIKTPDPESETPTRIQPIKPLPFTNGVLKRHQPFHHHHHHLNSPPVVVSYKECLKNHAASLGGHAVDGCGEFMPSPSATHVDPTSLKCAACGCHRNFHRREPDDINPASALAPSHAPAQHVIEYQPHHRHHPPPPPPSRGGGANSSSPNSPSPPPISSSYYPSAPHMLLALSAGVPPENNLPIPTTPGTNGINPNSAAISNGRKRFRTKFTPDQKEKMHEFAERVGWKMQKRDEEIITGFCNEIGVEKGVFKVWMHNNKSTFGKKSDAADNNGNYDSTPGGDRINNFSPNENSHHYHHHNNHHEDTGNSHSNNHNHHQQLLHNNGSVSTGNVVATNGSSSSS